MTESEQPTATDRPTGSPIGDGRSALADFRPVEVEQLCETVREQVAAGQAIYPRGGGTAMEYGGIPRRPGVAVDTRSLDRLIDYPAADMTITVQAGMTLSALRAILVEQHQRLLVDAPDPDRATLGGIYATNTTGSRRFGSGRPRDQIIGVSFVTSEGAVVKGGGRVVKNVAGYDFPKLLTGSMGTLGIIAQLTLKVRPIPEASAIAWVPLTGPVAAAELLERLNTSATRPMALDLLNAPAARAIGQALGLSGEYPAPGHRLRGQRRFGTLADRSAEERGWPGGFDGRRGRADARRSGMPSTVSRRRRTGPSASWRTSARPRSPDSCEGLDPGRWSVQAHAGNGIVRAHALGEWTLDEAARTVEPFRQRAVRDGGNLILSRCPTDWKERLRVWGEPRADAAVADRVRAALDPHGAMNPGRFVVG